MKKYCSRKMTTAFICILGFLVGIPFIYNGGFYLFDLVDGVATLVSLFIVLCLEAFLACIF
jgi:SNF family Na+-dependent transporter